MRSLFALVLTPFSVRNSCRILVCQDVWVFIALHVYVLCQGSRCFFGPLTSQHTRVESSVQADTRRDVRNRARCYHWIFHRYKASYGMDSGKLDQCLLLTLQRLSLDANRLFFFIIFFNKLVKCRIHIVF